LVGRITIDDVVDVIHEEHEEDIMHLGGVGGEDDFYSAVFATTRRRAFWLGVHFCAVLVASAVVGLFEATIQEMVALAILMPIVAALGGTAGTQTLTVTVRAIAMRELTSANALRLIGKEILVGGINGVVFAFLVGGVAWFWFGNPVLGVVIGMAMIANLLVAGLVGSALPFVLDRAGIDPAIASSPFLISVTDVVGFYVFLGLATVILL
jgi:magnesium transporter